METQPDEYLEEEGKITSDVKPAGQKIESKITVRLERRGSLYNITLAPELRCGTAAPTREVVADVHHPLWEKWQRVLSSMLQKEFKEED